MIATVDPAATEPQNLRALRQANVVRLARADLKRSINDGTTTVAEVLHACPIEARNLTIAELLLSQRGWGETRCRKFLASAGIRERKTLGALTERQRGAFAGLRNQAGTSA